MRDCIFLITILLCSSAFSQNKPKWIQGDLPESKSGNYYYGVGIGESEREATVEAIKALAEKMAPVDFRGNTTAVQIGENGVSTIKFIDSTEVDREEIRIETFPVRSYIDGRKYYVLLGSPITSFARPIDGGVVKTKEFVKRSFVPGWAQFYNEETAKGLIFSLGEVALIGLTVYSFGEAKNEADNADLALLSGNLAQFNSFKQSEDDWKTTGTIFAVSAGALWILNIVDATASRKNIYAMTQKKGFGLLASGTNVGFKHSF